MAADNSKWIWHISILPFMLEKPSSVRNPIREIIITKCVHMQMSEGWGWIWNTFFFCFIPSLRSGSHSQWVHHLRIGRSGTHTHILRSIWTWVLEECMTYTVCVFVCVSPVQCTHIHAWHICCSHYNRRALSGGNCNSAQPKTNWIACSLNVANIEIFDCCGRSVIERDRKQSQTYREYVDNTETVGSSMTYSAWELFFSLSLSLLLSQMAKSREQLNNTFSILFCSQLIA